MKYFKYFFFLPASILLMVASCSKSTTNSAETSGNWIRRSDADFSGRSESVSFVIGNLVYVGTGYDNYASNFPGINTKFYNYGRSNDLFVFDPSVNNGYGAWRQLSNMFNSNDTAAVRSSGVAFVCNGNGFVSTGYDGQYRLQDNWQYTPATNSWVRKAALPDENTTILGSGARYDAVAFSIRDTGYITSGFSNRDLNDLWQYQPAADKWVQKTSMAGSGREAAVAFVYKNQGYVVTGKNNGSTLNDFWSYNPSVDSWNKLRNITNTSTDTYDDDYSDIVRANAVAFVLGDYAYLATGENGGYTSKTWVYDINADQWTRKTPFERSPRSGAVGFTVMGRCFVGLGASSGSYYNNLDEFRPDLAYDAND